TFGPDRTMRVWNSETGALLFTFAGFAQDSQAQSCAGAWLAVDADGYYVDGNDGATYARIVVNGSELPLSCYAAILRSPEKLAAAAAGHPAPHPTLWSFPRVDVTAPFPEVLDTRSFEFAAFLTDSYGVAEVRVEQDGRALEEKDVHAACVFDTDAKRVHVTLKCAVPAPADRTSLCISARNIRNVWSPKTRVDLHYVAPTRTLYLLAMGVAKCDDHRL